MSFASPIFLVALLIVPLAIGAQRAAQRRQRRYPVRFTALETLAAVAPRGPDWRRIVPLVLFTGALASLALAAARPRHQVAVPVERASVVLVTDVSKSMEATDVSPSRLSAARNSAVNFLNHVPGALRVGLVAFSDGSLTLSTPTTEHDQVVRGLNTLVPIAGTSTGAGLTTALDDLQIGVTPGQRRPPSAIILLSDGSATDGNAAFEAAAQAKRLHVPIYTVALGTPDGQIQLPDGTILSVPPDPQSLKRIATLSGGKAYLAQDADQLDAVYQRLGSQIGTKLEPREISAGFAGIGLALLVAAIGGSLMWSGRLP